MQKTERNKKVLDVKAARTFGIRGMKALIVSKVIFLTKLMKKVENGEGVHTGTILPHPFNFAEQKVCRTILIWKPRKIAVYAMLLGHFWSNFGN